MALTVEGTPPAGTHIEAIGSVATTSLPKPSSAVTGASVLLAVHWIDSDGSPANATAAGWTQVGGNSTASNSTPPQGKIWWRLADASSTYTFGQDTNASNLVECISIGGADTTTPLASVTWGTGGPLTDTSHVAPSVTGTTGQLLVCAFACAAGGSPTYTPPSGMTEQVDAASGWVFGETNTLLLTSSGATGTKAAVATNAATGWNSVSILVSPASAATPITVRPMVIPSQAVQRAATW